MNHPISNENGSFMEQVYHVKLGDSRRLALPAELCRSLGLQSGEELLLTRTDTGVAVTPLRLQAEQMRQELKDMLGEGGTPLADDLKKLRQADAAREAPHR
jgi:bifunctional DNA-binding transcriptional regulator/antitoxin component of YhaV-PrlF toxin-antitoxin module